jgi:tetratricopeptide (TPR) repeat protein
MNVWDAFLSYRGRKVFCLVALGVVGCAAPAVHKEARRPSPVPQALSDERQATAAVFDERQDELQFQLAEARWRRNETEACQQTLEEIVAHNHQHREAHLRLAELYLLRNEPCRALSLMQRFCRANRDDAEAHHLLGLAYETIGQGSRALAAFDVAASLDPEDPIVRRSLKHAVGRPEIPPPDQQLASAAPSRAAALQQTADEQTADEQTADEPSDGELPPSRSPRASDVSHSLFPSDSLRESATAGNEPKRLGEMLTGRPGEVASPLNLISAATASDPFRPQLPIVPAAAPVQVGVEPDTVADPAEPAVSPPEGTLSKLSGPGDRPLPTQYPGSPIRWAYELEVGDAKPMAQDVIPVASDPAEQTSIHETADVNEKE